MKFRSYAQNFEDVILNRAFKDQAGGFYVDVGTCHPSFHSVTKSFYDRGWSGINIEPGTAVFGAIQAERGRDINLNVGLSREEGTMTFFESTSSIGRSTFQASWRDDWTRLDGCRFEEKTVPVTTLARVFEQHVKGTVDFLKVDVEGHERGVLEGGDFSRWRPRVVLVEGVEEVAREWEFLLRAAGYHFAAFDGINRYHVRDEDRHLIPILAAPVSIVDDFELDEYRRAIEDLEAERAEHDESRQRLAEATARAESLDVALAEARARVGGLEGDLAELAAKVEEFRGQPASDLA